MSKYVFGLVQTVIIAIMLFGTNSYAQTPAFPGAEGWGKYTTGGRGGNVYEVTNLSNSGAGSLRDAVSQPHRIVVFRVSGNIEMESELVIRSNITIAGQTAPGDGICVKDYPTKIDGNNVIIRYIRFRLGDRYELASDALDANKDTNIIIDHCAMTWGVDECFSAYDNYNMTVQWCIVGEALNLTDHSMGGLWGGWTTYHHNLITSCNTRHPKYAYTYDKDITDSRNNVIYNWGHQSAYTSPTGRVNLVNNYYKAGPATNQNVNHRIVQAEPTKRMHITGNYVHGFPDITADNWNGGVDSLNGGMPIKHDDPFPVAYSIPVQSPQDAYDEIVAHCGASLPRRDAVDQRMIQNLLDSTGFILFRQSDVGGYPTLNSEPAPVDTDHDGMPDDWENSNGLNPADPSDGKDDQDSDGYTNVEEYINSLTEYPDFLPRPTTLVARAVSESKINLTWDDNSADELGFVLERLTDSTSFDLVDSLSVDAESYTDSLLTELTTYYYRIKAYGDTLSSSYSYSEGEETFADGALPGVPVNPLPADEEGSINLESVDLSWEPGKYTLTYSVYFGISSDALALQASNLTETTYQVTDLDLQTVYYWRVDATNNVGTTSGDIWSFTTREPVQPELSGYWPLNEESGFVVNDSSNYKNDGLVMNLDTVFWTTGKYGNCLDFSNYVMDSYVSIPHASQLYFDNNSFSIAFWMNSTAESDGPSYLVQKGSYTNDPELNTNGKWYGIEIKDNEFRFAVDDDDTKTVLTAASSDFVTGQWVHVVAVRDTVLDKLRLYKNASLHLEVTDETEGIGEDEPLLIGNRKVLDSPYNGKIDELTIYSHALTQDQIDSLYQFNKIPVAIDHSVKMEPVALQCHPNPFNNTLNIQYYLDEDGEVLMNILDVNGIYIKMYNEKGIRGVNTIIWDGTGANHIPVSNGLYFVVLQNITGKGVSRTAIIKR